MWSYIPILFPFLFIAIWLVMGFFLSRTGWKAFADCYPAPDRPSGKAYQSRAAQFNDWAHYKSNTVRIILTDTGVYFSVLLLFRTFHPPFLVPWESVKRIQKKKIFFWHSIQIDVEDPVGKICVLLPTNIEEELLRYSHRTSKITIAVPV